ncbi:carbohydrate ABC transporter permease [Robinsoniella peoriensis]|uniref:Lactose transport system permease protein LacF n=1 Tax=Robinsoniella peoriensis TaxID=180332 RepID=A0A4U8Q441_9FIRM|nr:sugar ABC transporter permease [Robinsoniella peoriensis]TLC99571.1 Lactose transport system permease protein LacF [Robinsoniella peoriensis]
MDMRKKYKFNIYKESTAGVIFTLPFIIGFLLFLIVPLGISLYYAFCDYGILTPAAFTGLNNFRSMMVDELFWKSLGITVFYSVVSVPLKLVFALLVAILFQKTTKATGLYRALYYLPSIIGGSVAVSILWKRMFATDGMVNQILHSFGVQTSIPWLGNANTAIWTLILLTVWQFGSSMLIFLSSLKQIPRTFYEASTVDGAGKWRQFTSITLPLLTPTIFFNLVMQMINGLLAFTQCFIITQGQPLNSTLFYMVHMYNQSFVHYNTGYGAALAWVMILIVGFVTAILFATKKRWVYDGGF